MKELNLPYYRFRFKNDGTKSLIFDELRKKYLVCSPEEWVRQNLIKYLINEKNVPSSFISLEKEINLNELKRRYDALIHSHDGSPIMLVECKAPGIKIKQEVFTQIAEYNIVFKVPYLFVSNGIQHYVCRIDIEERKIEFLRELPDYQNL